MAEHSDIERKLSAASTWLIIDKPFLGALVLRLPVLAADPKWCRTTATDARALYYNPDYIATLDLEQTKFALAHEALHCALSHFHRRGHRDKRRWDIACDYAVNPLLVADGLKPPPNVLLLDGFEDMTAEEIYPFIRENTDEETHDQHAYDSDTPQSGA
jgi:predicted metal-dependent peptidase